MYTDVDGALAAFLYPFVAGATSMVWGDECVNDSEVNHELLFKEKDKLRALKKHNPKLDYKTSDIETALETIRQQRKARGHDFGLSDEMCGSGPRSWQMVQARRITCMLRHISKAERAAKPPMWTKLLFKDDEETEATHIDFQETQVVLEVQDSDEQPQDISRVEDLAPFPQLTLPRSF